MSLTIDDVIEARERIDEYIVKTPLINNDFIDSLLHARVYFKAESLQRTGAFKIRGAMNKILKLKRSTSAKGFVTYSSGNHGAAVATAASLVGAEARIVVPETAPQVKIDTIRRAGGTVVTYNPNTESREPIAAKICADTGFALVPPFDDHDVIAGQGTIGLEIADALDSQKVVPDAVVAPCSGGGLSAGVVFALNHRYHAIRSFFVEPAGLEKMAPSVATGIPHKKPAGGETMCDGLLGPTAGTLTTPILAQYHAKGMSAQDSDVLVAMKLAFEHLKLVLEPAGAAAFGAVLKNAESIAGLNIVIVCSGGNVDAEKYAHALLDPRQ